MSAVQYHTFSTSKTSREGRMQFRAAQVGIVALAVAALVAVVTMRSSHSRTELAQMSFPGIGKMVANWITEWGKLSNIENINGRQLGNSPPANQVQPAHQTLQTHDIEVSHLDRAAQLRRANGWIFDAKGSSKGYLFDAPKRQDWMERAPTEKGWMDKAPTEKGWMFSAPEEKQPAEDPAAVRRHAQGWLFDAKEATPPVESKATLRQHAQGWMFDLPTEKKQKLKHAPSDTSPSTKVQGKDVGTAWKKWATEKASSLHEKIHRIAVGPGGWEVFVDAKSGRPFYYNRQDDISSWESPWSPQETKKTLRSASSSSSSSSSSAAAAASKALEHVPVSGLDAVRALPQQVSSKVGRVFDVNAQEDDMNSYFDALQHSIDGGITARNNKLIQERGIATWHPQHEQRYPQPSRGRAVHERPAPSFDHVSAPTGAHAAVRPKRAARQQQQQRQRQIQIEEERAQEERRAAQLQHERAERATRKAMSEPKKMRTRQATGANPAVVLPDAWDSMEGGEGSDTLAREHI